MWYNIYELLRAKAPSEKDNEKLIFGEGWREAKEYLEKNSVSFDLEAMKQNTNVTAQDTGCVDVNSKKAGIIGNTKVGNVIATVPEMVDKFAPVVEKILHFQKNATESLGAFLNIMASIARGFQRFILLFQEATKQKLLKFTRSSKSTYPK